MTFFYCENRILITNKNLFNNRTHLLKEAVPRKCSVTKTFLETLQNSQENTGVRVSFRTSLNGCEHQKLKLTISGTNTNSSVK